MAGMVRNRMLRNGIPILVTSGSEERSGKIRGVTRQEITASGAPTTNAISKPALSGKHSVSVEHSHLLRATIPRTEDVRPSTEATISLLLKTERPNAARALVPNLPIMTRSISAITKVELSARIRGNANLDKAAICFDVDIRGGLCIDNAAGIVRTCDI